MFSSVEQSRFSKFKRLQPLYPPTAPAVKITRKATISAKIIALFPELSY